MRLMRARWILASTAAVALACVGAAQPAWAGGDKEEKGGQREEFHIVIDGLDGELLERAAGELKEHHPAVKVRIKEGVLKLYSEDGAAWKKAMHALTELGVPVGPGAGDAPDFGGLKVTADGKELRVVLKDKEREGPPADKDIQKKMAILEEQLVAARQGGREREVAELEQALEQLRRLRKELAGKHEKHAKQDPDLAAMRKQLEEAKRALQEAMQSRKQAMPAFELQEAEIREMKRHLEAMGREMGAERKRPGPPSELRQRMEHTRQALKHLKEAGLPDQARQVEQALHRMEMAAEGEGRGPDGNRLFVKGHDGELRVIEVQPAAEGHIPGPPRRAPQRAQPPPPAPMPQECPPPSVGGFRRGPIHPRPQAQPPRRAFPPPAPAGVERPIGQGRVVGPDGAPQPGVFVFETPAKGPEPRPAQAMLVRSGEPRPLALRAAAAPLRVAPAGPSLSLASPGDLAGSVEQLRAEMAQLRAQLHLLMHQLADDDDDDDDDDEDDDKDEKRSPRR